MARFLGAVRGWFGRFGAAGAREGMQRSDPYVALVEDTSDIGVDGALQVATVWACIERRAKVVASLPLFVYEQDGRGDKVLASRTERLFQLLHDSPNSRMTPTEFWVAMMMWHDLRGNAYARIDRDAAGEPTALWPMPTDQTQPHVLDDGSMVYEYRIDSDVVVLAAENVLHLKGLGSGTVGLDKLAFMRATTNEAGRAQAAATKMFSSGGKPTGVLMIDKVLRPDQREALLKRFEGLAIGNIARLAILEANMKYQQLSLSPEDQQLLETRQFGIEEICRWFDVPPVLAFHSNVTTWGSGVEQIINGWYKTTIGPLVVSLQQAVRKRVLSARQRGRFQVEFNLDALLRADPAARAEIHAKALQNGWATRNQVRQLENWPRVADPMADELTVQSNLVPLRMLGQQPPAQGGNNSDTRPVAQ